MSPTPDDLITAAVLINMYSIHFMEVDGRVENNLSILNLSQMSLFGLPYSMMKTVMGTTQGQFKGRARTIFQLSAPRSISMVWNTVKYFMDELTSKKVVIYSSPTCQELFDLAHPS